jgi:hypothetical protein
MTTNGYLKECVTCGRGGQVTQATTVRRIISDKGTELLPCCADCVVVIDTYWRDVRGNINCAVCCRPDCNGRDVCPE